MALIVTGHQRSGTTLVARLLNAHPQVRMTGEFGNYLRLGAPFPTYVRRMLQRWGGIAFRSWPLAVTFESPGSHREVVYQNNRFVIQYLRRLRGLDADKIITEVIERVLHELLPGAKVVGDKYPEYIWDLESLARDPGLSILVLCRDCRDVTSSTLEKARTDWRRMPVFVRRLNSAEKVAHRWVRAVELMEANRDRIFVMRYEELVTDVTRTLARLSEWLEIDPEGFDCERISSRSIGKYRNGLTHSELDTVMEIAGPTMARHDYS